LLKKGFPQANVLIFHAVPAVKSDGTDSFFSNLPQNNDRDHDDYCLGIDGFFLLKSGEVAAGKPLTQELKKCLFGRLLSRLESRSHSRGGMGRYW